MLATINFEIPEESNRLVLALNSEKYLYALRSFDQQLSIIRQKAKNGDEEVASQLDTIEWIQDLFRECCNAENAAIWHF
jgi:hypothetical protein